MTTFTNTFDSYQIFYYGGLPASSHFQVVVQCIQGEDYVGRMAFMRPGVPVPANDTVNLVGTDIPSIYYPFDSFQAIFEILKRIKPLYLFLDTNSHVGMLATGQPVPIGEEQGK